MLATGKNNSDNSQQTYKQATSYYRRSIKKLQLCRVAWRCCPQHLKQILNS